MTAALVLGAVTGFLLGLLGGGGSILVVPALVYGAGQPLTVAVPTSLLVVGISSAGAVMPAPRSTGCSTPASPSSGSPRSWWQLHCACCVATAKPAATAPYPAAA